MHVWKRSQYLYCLPAKGSCMGHHTISGVSVPPQSHLPRRLREFCPAASKGFYPTALKGFCPAALKGLLPGRLKVVLPGRLKGVLPGCFEGVLPGRPRIMVLPGHCRLMEHQFYWRFTLDRAIYE